MTVLVTGGAGYIGSHTVRQLQSSGRDVVILDSLELSSPVSVLGARLVEGDIRDEKLVKDICARYNVQQVVHFAAYKNVGESMSDPAKYWRNNIAGTVDLVEAVLSSGVTEMVFSSSCSVNGTPDVVPVTEEAAIRPESVYAQTKATMEEILGWYTRTSPLRVVNLRYFNAAGASHDAVIGENWEHSQNLIPLVMKALLGKISRLQVFGNDYPTPDGTCIRDYIHVEDLATAHEMALQYLSQGGPHNGRGQTPHAQSLNCGTGIGTSVYEVITIAEEISGRAVPYDIVERRAGDPAATFADPRLIKKTLGWEPKFGIREIVDSAWRWHTKNIS
jgi:UDP-glucose-4-epimerase GalE